MTQIFDNEIISFKAESCERIDKQFKSDLLSRSALQNLIEQGLDVPLSFRTYPHEQQWLLDLRERVNNEIEKR